MKTIGILTYPIPDLKSWDPESIFGNCRIGRSGHSCFRAVGKPGGSGHRFWTPPQDRSIKGGSQSAYVDLDFFPADAGYCDPWRMPQIRRGLKRLGKKDIFGHRYLHSPFVERDDPDFNDVLWVSGWQRAAMDIRQSGICFVQSCFWQWDQSRRIPFRNRRREAIHTPAFTDRTMPEGWKSLAAIWPAVRFHFPRATLDIYYGWQTWGIYRLSARRA